MKTYQQLAIIFVLPLVHAACSSGDNSGAASGGQDLSNSGAAPASPAKATTPAAASTANAGGANASGPPANLGGPYEMHNDAEGTDNVITFSSPTTFDIHVTNTASPSPYNVTWTDSSHGAVFFVDFITKAPQANSCGTITIHPGVEILFNKDNNCALLEAYTAAPYLNANKNMSVDIVEDGISLIPVDPATGVNNMGDSPENFNLTWTGPTAANISEAGASTSCGTLTADPVQGTLVLTGCAVDNFGRSDLSFAGTYQH